MFDVHKAKNACVYWIRDFFENNGKGCNAVIGVSGGKDSSVAAALCCEALGKERVIGVLMPCGKQTDIDKAYLLCELLKIKRFTINIEDAVKAIKNNIPFRLSNQSKENLPPRIRTATLYAVSQSNNGRVANTCNLSENYVGYVTVFGDAAGDFSPLGLLTVREVKEIGRALGLPDELIDKVPADGLTGKTDEENLGFTYDELDEYIRTGKIENMETKRRIDFLHEKNLFKFWPMPTFKPEI